MSTHSVEDIKRGSGRLRVRVEAEFFDLDFVDSYWALTTTVMYGIPFEF